MEALIVVLVVLWFGITFVGGIMVITSKALWSPCHVSFRERFDTKTTVGALMLLFGVSIAMLLCLPALIW